MVITTRKTRFSFFNSGDPAINTDTAETQRKLHHNGAVIICWLWKFDKTVNSLIIYIKNIDLFSEETHATLKSSTLKSSIVFWVLKILYKICCASILENTFHSITQVLRNFRKFLKVLSLKYYYFFVVLSS